MSEEERKPPVNGQPYLIFLTVVILVAVTFFLFSNGKVTKLPAVTPPPFGQGGETQADYAEFLKGATVSSLFGEIKAAGSDLTIDVPKVLGVAIPEGSPARTRSVRVSAGTKIFDRRFKSQSQFQKELLEYRASRGKTRGGPPAPYTFTPLTLRDLAIGDTIMVTAVGGANIKDAAVIEAAEITRVE